MKYLKTKGYYQASNVTFNPEAMSAYSYGHWKFVSRINGLTVFNNHAYSVTTQAHQRKVRKLMDTLGIKIDVEIDTRLSLVTPIEAIRAAHTNLSVQAFNLLEDMKKPRTQAKKNAERLNQAMRLMSRAVLLVKFFPEARG